ncbi:hypothetical protein GCM10009765_02710 [Fodinicola feengrottensis]|uniref:Carrier domain-containing protein n=2 Tax=Fodinicola feengrottensis TaxID=435914 RepID=A0ABP4RLU3_9ACTN
MWLADRLEPGAGRYVVPLAWQVDAEISVPRLEKALAKLVERHEILRTSFRERDGRLYQVVGRPWLPAVEEVEGDRSRWLRTAASRPFDVTTNRLLRVSLAHRRVLLLCVHHLIWDAASIPLFFRELDTHYAGRQAPAVVQFEEFVRAQRAMADEAEGLDYWTDFLAGAPAYPAVPPPLRTGPPGAVPVRVPDDLFDRLAAMSGVRHISWFMVLAAGLAALLHRWTGQDDVTIGVPVANRDDFPETLGPCLNTVVVRSRITAATTVRQLLDGIRDQVLDSLEYQGTPFEAVVGALNPPRRPGWVPYADVTLAATTAFRDDLRLGDARLVPYALDHDDAGYAGKFGLTATFEEIDGRLRGVLMYRGDRFTTAEVRRMAGWLGRFTHSFDTALDLAVKTLDLLDVAELAEIHRFEAGPPAPAAASVPAAFDQRCADQPDAVAIGSLEGDLTYRELASRADAVAAVLSPLVRDALVRGRPPVVVVVLPRGPDLVAAMLAAWRAGSAFCPVSPGQPVDRLAFILADLDASAVITDDPRAIRAAAATGTAVLRSAAFVGTSAQRRPQLPNPDDTAYVLYTSGTTGEPKGVTYSHRSLASATRAYADFLGVHSEDRISWIHDVSFDMTQCEVWPALCAGATICPYEHSVVVADLAGWLAYRHVTVAFTPTPLAEVLWTSGADLTGLRWLVFAGSPLTALPPASVTYRICDAYGPTETFIATMHAVSPKSATALNCVGRPVAGARVFVLDQAGQRCPVGMPGEIHVGGATVADGYWRRPELTSERFAERTYRTGDRGRWLTDGTLEYLGRADRQLKIRGYRVEPAEIEARLHSDPAVRAAAVHGHDGSILVAYLVAAAGTPPDTSAVVARLRTWLPAFMIPTAMVWLAELPMNERGKVDTARLPRPGGVDLVGHRRWTPPRTELERRIAAVWTAVLGVESVSVDDNFFDIGGNSLLLAALHARLAAELDAGLTFHRLFEFPTVRALARAFAVDTVPADATDDIGLRARRARQARAARVRPPRRDETDH